MNLHKGTSIIKYCVITSTTSLVLITISIFPISKRAYHWNRCFTNTMFSINEKSNRIEDWDLAAKHSLAVSVCNGAVYEPSLKNNSFIF